MTAMINKLKPYLEKRGYFFNPDEDMTTALLEGLVVNEKRYGYPFCPCRLATGDVNLDRDAICPCNVRDWDINEFNTCFCGLYVSREVFMQKKAIQSIPDRRNSPKPENKLWRCQVCGYICARPHPPDICPICGVSHDRFEPYTV
jgi:ferredoxin-thioredoxin reductase catalytic subunit